MRRWDGSATCMCKIHLIVTISGSISSEGSRSERFLHRGSRGVGNRRRNPMVILDIKFCCLAVHWGTSHTFAMHFRCLIKNTGNVSQREFNSLRGDRRRWLAEKEPVVSGTVSLGRTWTLQPAVKTNTQLCTVLRNHFTVWYSGTHPQVICC
jgi:hypothetical protein